MKTKRYFLTVREPDMVLAMVQILAGVHPEMAAEAGDR